MRSLLWSVRSSVICGCASHLILIAALGALLFIPAGLQAQYISYAGAQSTLPVTGLLAPLGVTVDMAGNRYIADYGQTDVIKYSADGVQTTISSTLHHPYGIAVDGSGNLYVADQGNNRVLKIPAGGGTQTTVGSGFSGPLSVAVDSVGNLYVVDYGNSRVEKVAPGGAQTQVAASQLSNPAAVAVDSYDNVYITDAADNSLILVTPSGSASILLNNILPSPPFGVAVDRFGNIFVSAQSGRLELFAAGNVRQLGGGFGVPFELAADQAGTVYLADPESDRITVIAPGAIDMGTANLCPSSGTQTAPCTQTATLNFNVQASNQNIFSVAVKVATQGAENLDYTATANTCTGDFTSDTTCAITVNFKPSAPGIRLGAVDVVGVVAPPNTSFFPGSQRPGTRPNFVLPTGATELSTVYVHGLGVGPIAAFDAGLISTLPVTLVNLNYVVGLTPDSSGNLFVVDEPNCVISEFNIAGGTTSVVAGTGSRGATAGDGGLATSATFADLWRVAIDARGDLYIPDPRDSVIRKVDAITGIITTIAGSAGTTGHTPDGVIAVNATLTTPLAVAVDGAGNLFYTDENENLIRRIDASSGVLTTVAGNFASGPGYSGDGGPATSAQLNQPYALALDTSGNLYIADNSNNVIRKITVGTGIITTVAGQGPPATPGYAGDGGPATSALLLDPEGMTVDAAGNLYIADSNNLLVRKVNASTGVITTAAGVYNGGDGGLNGAGNDRYTGDGGAATLAGLSYLEDVAVDGSGNFYIADSNNNVVRRVAVASGVATFGTFAQGTSSGAIDVTLVNDGNSTLDLSALPASANFNLSGPNTSCSSSSALTPGESCVLGIEFLPIAAGSLTGTIALTDNVGNNSASTQSVALSGVGLPGAASKLAISGVAATVARGGNLGTVEVSVEASDGTVVSNSTASITLTITGPGGYSQTVTATAVNGIATFNLASLNFSTVGSYTVTATSVSLTSATAPFTVSASVAAAAKLALPTIPANLAQGGNLGSVEVSVETSDGVVVSGSSASITLTITGPGGYAQTLSAAAVNGVADFDLNAYAFATLGDYAITATSSGLTSAAAAFTVEQDFTLTPSAGTGATPTQSVAPGAAAVYLLQLAPAGVTFNGPITLSATGLPPGATYSFTPAIVTPGAAPAATTLTVDTAKSAAGLHRGQGSPAGPLNGPLNGSLWELGAILPAMFLLPLANWRGRRREARPFRAVPLLLLLLSLGITGLSGCGAGGLFGQPQASYTITVTGTSGALAHSTTVTLTIQ